MLKEKIMELLPIGSVVLLKEAKRKLMIIGVLQIQPGEGKLYDYAGVVYPEGYMGLESCCLFSHEDIDSVMFRGYEDEERTNTYNVLVESFDETLDYIKKESLNFL